MFGMIDRWPLAKKMLVAFALPGPPVLGLGFNGHASNKTRSGGNDWMSS